MNQTTTRTIAQLIIGVVALAIMAFWVHTGDLDSASALSIVGAVLAAFGFGFVGHQQARKQDQRRAER